jgi:UDP-glucose 4-epimerase
VIDAVKRISGRDFEVRLADRRPGDPAAIVAASDKIRSALNWTPEFDNLDTIVSQALRWEEELARREQTS